MNMNGMRATLTIISTDYLNYIFLVLYDPALLFSFLLYCNLAPSQDTYMKLPLSPPPTHTHRPRPISHITMLALLLS